MEEWWARPGLIYLWLGLSLALFATAVVRLGLMFWLLAKLLMTPIDMLVGLLGIWGAASYVRCRRSQGHSRTIMVRVPPADHSHCSYVKPLRGTSFTMLALMESGTEGVASG